MGQSEKSNRLPAAYNVSWKGVLLQLLVIAALITVVHQLLKPTRLTVSLVIGLAIYLVYSQTVRWLVGQNIIRGYFLLKKGAYPEAIEAYEKGYEFFTRHPWLDEYRYLLLLRPSAYSYREVALCNVAFAYGQMGEGNKAIEGYRRVLSEFPDCPLAKSSLRLAEGVRRDAVESAD